MAIEVSIICNTYNHEKYIEETIQGFINQHTNFDFEVLIHDDASTDNTAEIIRKYEKQNPNLIKAIYQKENQYSKGVSISRDIQLTRAKGKYIAFCEGDDYWTDPNKLQVQYDTLENNDTIDMCSHVSEVIDGVTGKHIKWVMPIEHDGVLTLKQVIEGGGGCLATSSLFYRREVDENPPKFRMLYSFDYTLQVAGALRGGVYFIAKPMSVYRLMTPGSWTTHLHNDTSGKIKHKLRVRSVLKLMNEGTDYQFRWLFLRKIMDNYIRTSLLYIKMIILGSEERKNVRK